MPKGKVSKGDAAKRVRMKSSNPRGPKRGGFYVKHPGVGKNFYAGGDYTMYLHLLFHHLKGIKRRKQCRSPKCPFRFKVFQKKGDIPFVPLIKK